MKPSKRLARLCRIFVEKDWAEFRKPIVVITGLFVPILMMAYPEVRPDLAKDMVAGPSMAAPFIYAQSCFYAERQHGTLQFLLALPIALGAPTSFLDCGPADAAISSLGEVAMVCVPRNPPGLSRPPVRTRDRYRFLLVLFTRSTELNSRPWQKEGRRGGSINIR